MHFSSVLALLAYASPALATVSVCTLQSTEEHISPSLALYEHEGATHSATLEYTTDYGDTLPYLFVCNVNCVMDMVGDDYRYILGVEPDLRNPELVALVTESKTDDFRNVEAFRVESCEKL